MKKYGFSYEHGGSIVATGSVYDHHSDQYDEYDMHNENYSYQCYLSSSCLCDSGGNSNDESFSTKSISWLIFRWMKFIFIRIARSYHAEPLSLVVFPILLGIAIGYFFGRRSSTTSINSINNISCCNVSPKNKAMVFFSVRKSLLNFWTWFYWNSFRFISIIYSYDSPSSKSLMPRNDNSASTISIERNNRNIYFPLDKTQTAAVSTATLVVKTKNGDYGNNGIVSKGTETEPTSSEHREEHTRTRMNSDAGTKRESDRPIEKAPEHVAVIMDGNRRYGKQVFNDDATRGHWDGSSKLVEFAKWCLAEQVKVLTVFAFSSENWNREPEEIASLMDIFAKYCDELRVEAIQRNIRIDALSTDVEKIPYHVRVGMKRMVDETKNCDGMIMNICLSYGGRDEIVLATKSVVDDVLNGKLQPDRIDETAINQRLLTGKGCNCSYGDPDILIRTSGEVRISNFLLWQLAYTELFFVHKPWPAIEKTDLIKIIRLYVDGRNRRYGK